MAKLTPEQLKLAEAMAHNLRYECQEERADLTLGLLNHIAALDAENARYKEALGYYAQMKLKCEFEFCDGGERARSVLKGDSNQ